jgi:arabinan endo-1,5-alpha-L-arabinosidase
VALTAALLLVASLKPMVSEAVEPFNAVIHVHDPTLVREKGMYYLFSTGPGVQIRRSKDLVNWTFAGQVFPEGIPPSAKTDFADSKSTWAPEVAYFNGKYHLYYSVSRFGTNRSYIGLATNKTLDPAGKNYKWVDEGQVIASKREDNFNAIDANLVFIAPKKVALSFGSFWSGIKMVDLDWETGKAVAGAHILGIASREHPNAIEGPFIFKKKEYYYLLVSFDLCCRGVNSTYNIRVGRSLRAEGPYVDKDGKPMLEGGGSLLLGTEGAAIGPGHCSVYTESKRCLLVYHYYDGNSGGVPTLQIRPMSFGKDGWPKLGEPLGGKPPKTD